MFNCITMTRSIFCFANTYNKSSMYVCVCMHAYICIHMYGCIHIVHTTHLHATTKGIDSCIALLTRSTRYNWTDLVHFMTHHQVPVTIIIFHVYCCITESIAKFCHASSPAGEQHFSGNGLGCAFGKQKFNVSRCWKISF